MSIIFIDDIIFNDNEERRIIRYNNCIFFLVLNSISIFSGIFYLYFYFKIPYYQNISNSLSLILNILHLISNSFYFLIFFEFYLYEPIILSPTIKIITMFNPLIIMCIYYWSACLTHNLYVTYYNYVSNMNKRIMFYKYLLFIFLTILYICTLLSIDYNDSQILSKSFTFISNYNNSFISFFYICGFFIIIYIIIKLYYIINKKEDFISIHEYQENEERNIKIKNIFNSVIARNITFVCYFLITFTPANMIMLFKYFLGKTDLQIYWIDYMVIMLISFNGTFLFIVRLFDPLMRNFVINLLSFNREFISNYKNNILNEKRYNELMNETESESNSEKRIKIIDFPYNYNYNENNIKLINHSLKNSKNLKDSNQYDFKFIKKNGHYSKTNKKDLNDKKYEMINISDKNTNFSNLSQNIDNNDKYNSETQNISNSNSIKNKIENLKSLNKNINNEINDKNENKNITNIKTKELLENNENKNNTDYFHINSFGSFDNNINNNNNFTQRLRSNSLSKITIYDRSMVNKTNKNQKNNKSSLFKKSFLKYKYNTNKNVRANSPTNQLERDFIPLKPKKRRSSSKLEHIFFHEEISSFALMNYNLEINENLLRMIAISVSIDDCRKYDKNIEYKKYYTSNIPWKKKYFYTETTVLKEYNDENIPNWLGIKNDLRFTNIQFKVMSYCPFVFHHIRLIDNVSIDDLLLSLKPINNIKNIKEMKVSGGRGNNLLTSTWDKKIIIKSINEEEKQILIDKMITDYHYLMNESKSILSRIYGIFKIELKDKGSIIVIIQRNMNDLPLETKLLTFDFKGSTVNRQTIDKEDIDLDTDKLIIKYKNKVLKDIDFGIIGIKIELKPENMNKLISIIDNDSLFLQKFEITDYSLVVFVHKYRKEDYIKNKGCSRIIAGKDEKYLFNFSIVDFLGTFNLEKKGEKLAKSLVGYIKKLKDTNFSVLDPYNYGKRFRNFCKTIII